MTVEACFMYTYVVYVRLIGHRIELGLVYLSAFKMPFMAGNRSQRITLVTCFLGNE